MSLSSKIFVTGGTGFVGSYVLRLLVEHGYHHIYALHRPSADRSLLLPREKNINWVPGDVLDVVLMEEYLEDVDIVIHAAAMISYHQRDLRLMELTNVQGTANLVNAALTQGVKHFIMVSSIAALGGTHKDGTIDERVDWRDDLFHSQYAWSKYLSELEVHRGLAEGLGVSIVNPGVILGSLPWIHGTGQFFKRIHHGLKFYPQGTTGFVDVRDVAVAIKILVEKGPTQERFILTAENLSYRVVFNAHITSIVVAIIGNAAEHSSAILMAMRNKMDLSLGIALGSSLQIALFVAPILIFASYLFGMPMNLEFTVPEVVAVIASVLIAQQIASDGESNWVEGLQLLAVYTILGILFFFLPDVHTAAGAH